MSEPNGESRSPGGAASGPQAERAWDWIGLGLIAAMLLAGFALSQRGAKTGREIATAPDLASPNADAEAPQVITLEIRPSPDVELTETPAPSNDGRSVDPARDRPPAGLDAASELAREAVLGGEGAEEQLEPFATAFLQDRGETVIGEEDRAAESELEAVVEAIQQSEQGGYTPPGAPMPGLFSARQLQQGFPMATATAVAQALGELLQGVDPYLPGEDRAATMVAATALAPSLQAAMTAAARAELGPQAAPTLVPEPISSQEVAPTPEAVAAVEAETDAESDAAQPAAEAESPIENEAAPERGSSAAPEADISQLAPVLAASVGLMALGLLLLRRGGRRRRWSNRP